MSASPPDVILRLSRHVALQVGEELHRLSPTQQAYLLLVCHGEDRGARRDDVIRLMWDEDENRSTRHRVRQLNYSLARKAGHEVVSAQGSWLSMAEGVRVHWDGTPFWELMEAPTGGYQEHLSLLGAARERAEEQSAARDLDTARIADSPEGVIQALENGPRPAGAWRDLLWALLRTGRIREAEFELQKFLGDDLPAEGPSLARRLASEAERLLGLAAAGAEESLVLRGRKEETLRLQELVLSGAPCVLLTGDQGAGRSRLLGQAVAFILANQDDVVLLSATGSPSERTRPFGGLEQLLDDELLVQAFAELGQPETEVIRQALPVQFRTHESHVIATLGGPGSYLRVAQAVGKLFHQAYGDADVVFLVDDLQELDRSSREVITRLVLLSKARMLATWCTGNTGDHTELVSRFKDLAPQLLHLRDLPPDQAVRLVQDLVEGIEEEDAEDVAQISGGRPGRIVELVRALDGPPMLAGPVVPSLDELLRRRIRGLDPTAQEGLIFLSVHGGRMPVAVLRDLLQIGLLETIGFLRELEAAGLVQMEGDTAAMTPGMLRQFIYREIPEGIRQDRHRQVADSLLTRGSDVEPGLAAHHLDQAGRPLEASDWYRKAGEAARERTAYAEAILLLEKSVSTGEGCPPEVAKALGALHSGMADFRSSLHWLQRARLGYREAGDAAGDIESTLEEAEVLLFSREPASVVLPLIRRQFRHAERLGMGRLMASCLELGFSASDFYMSRPDLDWCLGELEKQVRSGSLAHDMAGVGARLTYLGSPIQGLRLAKLYYLESRSHPATRLKALRRLVLALWNRGRFDSTSSQVLISSLHGLAQRSGHQTTRVALHTSLGLWYLDRGDLATAGRHLRQAQGDLLLPGDQRRGSLAINLAILSIREGAPLDAETHLQTFSHLPSFHGVPVELMGAAVRLFVAIEKGHMKEAAELDRSLAAVDLSFPFASNTSIIPEARAEFMRRTGRLTGAIHYLESIAPVLGSSSVPAEIRLRFRANEMAASTSRP